MDLIIKISDDDVKELHDRYIGFSDTLEGRILKAVAIGTPLPKGHGDLVDRSTIKIHHLGTEIYAQTVVEADKGVFECANDILDETKCCCSLPTWH